MQGHTSACPHALQHSCPPNAHPGPSPTCTAALSAASSFSPASSLAVASLSLRSLAVRLAWAAAADACGYRVHVKGRQVQRCVSPCPRVHEQSSCAGSRIQASCAAQVHGRQPNRCMQVHTSVAAIPRAANAAAAPVLQSSMAAATGCSNAMDQAVPPAPTLASSMAAAVGAASSLACSSFSEAAPLAAAASACRRGRGWQASGLGFEGEQGRCGAATRKAGHQAAALHCSRATQVQHTRSAAAVPCPLHHHCTS